LIAALSTGTVIVEAAKRSGARNTAAHCIALQRPLMAVPGPIMSPMSIGCHGLIRGDGGLGPALLVGCAADVLAVVGRAGEGLSDGADSTPVNDVRAELDGLDPVARRVYEGLGARRFARPDEIGARGGVSPLEVIRTLPLLELAGLVESSDAGYRIARRTRSAR
jgi:DNA processing protein